jgi:hypothetical protein
MLRIPVFKKILQRELEVRRIEGSPGEAIGYLAVGTIETAVFSVGKEVYTEGESSGSSGKNRVYQRRTIFSPLMIDAFFAVHGL